MPRRKPPGWPAYMIGKRTKGGWSYYWNLPTWAQKSGCPMKREPLGSDYAEAKRRCDELLNPQFAAWRSRREAIDIAPGHRLGTFDWLATQYKRSPKYRKLPPSTRKSYDAAIR